MVVPAANETLDVERAVLLEATVVRMMLVPSVMYRFVRHPIYRGILALTVGISVCSTSWAVVAATIALTGWFMAKARWEEGRLSSRYPAYSADASRTPRFVPFWPTRPAP